MRQKLQNKIMFFSLLIFLLVISITPSIHTYFTLPSERNVIVGNELNLNLPLPQSILANISLHINGTGQQPILAGSPVFTEPGKLNVELKLFDRFSIKKMSVNVIPEYKVYPGGQSIGVLIQSRGVVVIGYSPIYDNNQQIFPAKDIGINEGDMIIAINGIDVSSDIQIARIIDEAGKNGQELEILISQNDKERIIKMEPQFCQDTSRFRIGLFVRDTTAGVGTLSFYDNNQGVYGALGHIIADGETNKALDISSGKIVSAAVKGIEIGRRGQPGEKIGIFQEQSNVSGNIETNSEFGIFGTLKKPINHSLYREPIPVALGSEIKTGKAKILTVISDDKIEEFDIEIEKLYSQKKPNSKSMVIKITDQRLLNATGGIVQGMSGSPIIQNGKLVGAVTHVFVNDPTRGYGILAEWMLMEANLIAANNNIITKAGLKPAFFVGFFKFCR
ncbi:MAG: SpoIVB peptidase [Bacillota bacterium]|nr:SpoIVB peptidase [Bacillota bacterium]